MSMTLIPQTDELKAIEVIAKNAVDSKYFDKLGGYAGIFSIAMYARELGLPIMGALFGGMNNIMGKIQISPQLMNSMIRKAGHKLEINSTDTKCDIKGTRKDTGESCAVSFSVEDARKAGIFKSGGGWDKYPSDMCFARALSRLARRLFPDVIGMAYVEGEFEDDKIKNEPSKSLPKELPDAEFVEPVKPKITADQSIEIGSMIGDDMEMLAALLKWLSVRSLDDILEENFDKVVNAIKKGKEKKAKEAANAQ